MKKRMLLLGMLLLIISGFAYGVQPNPDPVIILYSDGGTGKMSLSDISTQYPPNRIIYHMLNVVLPEKYGINIKLKPIMWSRGLKLIKTGLADGIINASYNDERATYAVYPMKNGKPDPAKLLRVTEYSLFKSKKSTITWDGVKIDGIDGGIASLKSYAIIKDLEKMGIIVKEDQNTETIFRNLAIGKHKAAAVLGPVGDKQLADNPALKGKIIKFEKPLKKKEYYLIFSKKFYKNNEKLANAIWNAIENYSSSDEYHELKRVFEK
jgi:polar amino acid transport system substrate-binding protein